MSSLIQNIVQDDFVWRSIYSKIAGQGSMSRTGFFNIKCPICHDYKPRCGIKHDAEKITISCYNCPFTAAWSIGRTFSDSFKSFLTGIGHDSEEIAKLNYRAFQYRDVIKRSPDAAKYIATFAAPKFETGHLPPLALGFTKLDEQGCRDPDYLDAKAYVASRGTAIADHYEFFWSPSERHGMNRRVIVPIYYQGRTIGYSARAIDPDNKQRYHMSAPPNFVFGADALHDPRRSSVIIMDGILDAIALDNLAALGPSLNREQVDWIKSSGKKVIVLPDRDEQGQQLIDIALEHDWWVSFPCVVGGTDNWWDEKIKDAAQACAVYGRLWVITSVLQECTNHKPKINFLRKKLYK